MSKEHEIAVPPPSPCPECHGERIAAKGLYDVRLLRVDATFPDERKTTALWALVCTTCGYTSLYAQDPHILLPKA